MNGATGNTTAAANMTCHECPEGVKCDKKGSMISALWVKPGFFRATDDSKKVYPCELGTTACPGGNETGNGLCAPGYEGVLCNRYEWVSTPCVVTKLF